MSSATVFLLLALAVMVATAVVVHQVRIEYGGRGLAAVAVVVIVAGAAWWYFAVYDTVQGKCDRGDLGACLVWQAEQTPAP